MIERVYRQAQKASVLDTVLVATDHTEIVDHVTSFGGKVVMTSANHDSGTDRCAEALSLIDGAWDVVLNIQGDEPFISPTQINDVAASFGNKSVQIATMVRRVDPVDQADLEGPDVVKVVLNKFSEALYFSRSVIPFCLNESSRVQAAYYLHTGLYGFVSATLRELSRLPIGLLEFTESLEQLRWLENGYKIHAVLTNEKSYPVDTPSDLEKVKSTFGL